MIHASYTSHQSLSFRVLNPEPLHEIVQAAYLILERTGARIDHEPMKTMLKKAGAEIKNDRVYVPRWLTRECLDKAPKGLMIYNRKGQPAMHLDGYKTYYGTSTASPKNRDALTGEVHETTLADIATGIKVADALEHLDFVMPFGSAQDCPSPVAEAHDYLLDFYLETIKTKSGRMLNDGETRALFAKYGLTDYLDEVLDLVRQGKHFGVDCLYHKGYDIKFLGNMHNRKRGINNTRFGIVQGGIRRHAKTDPEIEVIIDGLNLARAMTFKNIAGDLPVGGSKSCVIMDELDLTNMRHMGFLGFCADELRTGTAPDMGFPPAMTDVMKEQGYSVQYTCGPQGPLGPSGKPTAYGVFLAMKEAVKFVRGSDDLTGLSFAVQGLGQVGGNLAKYLAEEVKDITLS